MALLVAMSPVTQAFWSRDLGGLAKALHEAPPGEERQYFQELADLLDCRPLRPVAPGMVSPARLLLRLEEARRRRLGAEAVKSDTLWGDVLRPDALRRSTALEAEKGPHLRWPDEDEEWAGEELRVPEPRSACGAPESGPDELLLLGPEFFAEVAKLGMPELSSRIALHGAVVAMNRGDCAKAAGLANRIDPDVLPMPWRAVAYAIRLETKVDPDSRWAAVDPGTLSGTLQTLSTLRRAQYFAEHANWPSVIAEVPEKEGPPVTPADRHLALLRARALLGSGHAMEAGSYLLDVVPWLPIGSDPDADDLRRTAWEAAARMPWSRTAGTLVDLAGNPSERTGRLLRVAEEAMSEGRTKDVAGVLDALETSPREPQDVFRCRALGAEMSFVSGRLNDFLDDVDDLLAPAPDLRLQDKRDAVLLTLAQHVVTTWSTTRDARTGRALERALVTMRETCGVEQAAAWEELLDGVRGGAAPVLDLRVAASPPIRPAPDVAVVWPEPYSLLAIPAPDGFYRDWLPHDATHIDTRGVPERGTGETGR